MEVSRNNGSLEISEIDPFLAGAPAPDPGEHESRLSARSRAAALQPAADPDEKELCTEWKIYVEPELRRLFRSATETVEADLQQLAESEKPFANSIAPYPREHSEAWLNALNQARLAIAAKYDFSEPELCDQYRSPIGSRRDLSLFQVNFYGFLQEFILREMECDSGLNSPNER